MMIGLLLTPFQNSFANDSQENCPAFLEIIEGASVSVLSRDTLRGLSQVQRDSLFEHLLYFRTTALNIDSGILRIYCNPDQPPTKEEFETIKAQVRAMRLPFAAKIFLVKNAVGRVDI